VVVHVSVGFTTFTTPLVGDAVSVTTGIEATRVYVTVIVGVSPGNTVSDVPGETADVYPETVVGVNMYVVPPAPGETVTEPEPVPANAPGLIVHPAVLRFEATEIPAVITTPIVTESVLVPPGPTHVSVYVVFNTGETDCEPEAPVLPVHGAEHDVAFVVDQVRVDEFPKLIFVGEEVNVTTGAVGGALVVSVAVTGVLVPPAFVHVSVYVYVPTVEIIPID